MTIKKRSQTSDYQSNGLTPTPQELKSIKGLTDTVKRKIEKAWTWGLITDEQFEELMEIQKGSGADAADGAGSDGVDAAGSGDAGTADGYIEESQYFY